MINKEYIDLKNKKELLFIYKQVNYIKKQTDKYVSNKHNFYEALKVFAFHSDAEIGKFTEVKMINLINKYFNQDEKTKPKLYYHDVNIINQLMLNKNFELFNELKNCHSKVKLNITQNNNHHDAIFMINEIERTVSIKTTLLSSQTYKERFATIKNLLEHESDYYIINIIDKDNDFVMKSFIMTKEQLINEMTIKLKTKNKSKLNKVIIVNDNFYKKFDQYLFFEQNGKFNINMIQNFDFEIKKEFKEFEISDEDIHAQMRYNGMTYEQTKKWWNDKIINEPYKDFSKKTLFKFIF